MRQRVREAIDSERCTYWGRVKPGSKPTLGRALERILRFSYREDLMEYPFIHAHHDYSCNIKEPPITFASYRESHRLDRLEVPEKDQGLHDDTLLYETAIVTNTEIDEIALPKGLVFLGHIPRFANDEEEATWPALKAFSDERVRKIKMTSDEVSRIRRANPDMPHLEAYDIAYERVWGHKRRRSKN